MAKTTLDFAKLVNKLYCEACSNGRTVVGNIYVNGSSDRLGGIDVQRTYEFPNYLAKDHAHYDKEDAHEFESSGIDDAFEYFRMKLLPSVTLEQIGSNGKGGLTIQARKTVLGQDPIV